MNISAGCAHGCLYCYAQGYRQYPGHDQVDVYINTPDAIEAELQRCRTSPHSVYFCPSCDAFQPVAAVQDVTYRTMQRVLAHGAHVEFLSKGMPSPELLSLFRAHPGAVSGQVGLATADERVAAILEAGAASVAQRLETVTALRNAGVRVSVRADPLIHGVSDTDAALAALVAVCAERGITSLSASYLFLRPAIRAALAHGLRQDPLLARILAPYAGGKHLAVRGSRSSSWALPTEVREEGFLRLRTECERQGMTLAVCGCKNPDLTDGSCYLTRGTPFPYGSPGLFPV